jgi:hypothetical protein
MTHLRTCSVCPPPTMPSFRHVQYKTEVTRGLDILPMLLSPAHTRYNHHKHMEAPNNGAAKATTPSAVWCSNTPACILLVLHCLIPEAFPLRIVSVSNDLQALYWLCLQSILPSWSLAASRSARSSHHYTSSCYSRHVLLYTAIDMLCSPAHTNVHNCYLK